MAFGAKINDYTLPQKKGILRKVVSLSGKSVHPLYFFQIYANTTTVTKDMGDRDRNENGKTINNKENMNRRMGQKELDHNNTLIMMEF